MPLRALSTAHAGAAAAKETPDANDFAVEARGADARALPCDVVGIVLRFLVGDVKTLCSAACVSRVWRAAASEPSIWRVLRFSKQRAVAHRLIDARLERLVKRAGAALECLDLRGCELVSLRGVVRALRGAPQLKQLYVRGVTEYMGPHPPPRPLVLRCAQLRTLVLPDGMFDAVATAGQRLALCMPADGRYCRRLCSAADVFCAQCRIYNCTDCRDIARLERFPPCPHLCDTCLKRPEDGEFYHCDGCGVEEGINGHCGDCIFFMCDKCNKMLCRSCAFDECGMPVCRNGRCAFRWEKASCHKCVVS